MRLDTWSPAHSLDPVSCVYGRQEVPEEPRDRNDSHAASRLPAYLRIAGILRAAITSGQIAPGAKLPSETQLMMRHQISRSVAKWAIAVLKADGLVDGHQGSGVFVRSQRRLIRRPRLSDWPSDEPLSALEGYDGCGTDGWSHRSVLTRANMAIAQRLAVLPGEAVWHVRQRMIDLGPLQLVLSWRLLTAYPHQPPDQLREQVTVRPADPEEIVALALPARGLVLAIAGTYTVQGVPVEITDSVMAADQCELIYDLRHD